MFDMAAYAKALCMLPQQFDTIVRSEDGYLLERLGNGSYTLWRKTYGRQGEYRWSVCGGVEKHSGPSAEKYGRWEAHVGTPYDAATGNDSRLVCWEHDEQAAVDALWLARHDAWVI